MSCKTSEKALDTILQFEQKRFEMLTKIEEARLKLQHDYAEKRAKLLSENKEIFSWLLDSLSDLRKERINFQKKAISEINESLQNSKVPEDLTKEWLNQISRLYHEDISLAQKMVSVDFNEIDNQEFDKLKEVINTEFNEVINNIKETEITDSEESTEA